MTRRMVGILTMIAAGLQPGLAAPVRTLPPQVYGQLHAGRKLAQVWVSPGFDPARGFRTGQVASAVTSIYGPAAVEALPDSLSRLADPAAPNVLTLAVVELVTRERVVSNHASVVLGVEGQVQAGDGALLAAFATRVESNGLGSPVEHCRAAADRVVAALAKELGMSLHPRPKAPAGAAAGPGSQTTATGAAGPGAMAAPAPERAPAAAPALEQAPAAAPVKAPAPAQPKEPAPRGQHF